MSNNNFSALMQRVQKAKQEIETSKVEVEQIEVQETNLAPTFELQTEVIKLETISLEGIIEQFSKHAPSILESMEEGIETPLEVFAQFKAVENIATYYTELVKQKALDFVQARGLKNEELKEYRLELGSSGDIFDYEQDATYRNLKSALKTREEQLKNAFKNQSNAVFYDSQTGEEIPIVQIKTYGKQYLKSTKK